MMRLVAVAGNSCLTIRSLIVLLTICWLAEVRSLSLETSAFEISSRWRIHIIDPVDETKLSCYTSHRRSTPVSLETYPSTSLNRLTSYRVAPLIHL